MENADCRVGTNKTVNFLSVRMTTCILFIIRYDLFTKKLRLVHLRILKYN